MYRVPTDPPRTSGPKQRAGTGLRLRLISFCLVVAVISIATTAWIAVSSTSSSINEQYTQNLSTVATVYDRLSGYAATHSSWAGVTPIVAELARAKHTRITLTRDSGSVIANSSTSSPALAGVHPAALINPLQPDTSVGDVSTTGGMDSRIIGPYRLPTAEQAAIRRDVEATRTCYERKGGPALPVQTFANGRTYLPTLQDTSRVACPVEAAILRASPGERAAGAALTSALSRCFPGRGRGSPGVLVVVSFVANEPHGTRVYLPEKLVVDPSSASFLGVVDELVDQTSGSAKACVENARRAQLAPYTAPPAQLYLSIATAHTRHGLSTLGLHRIVLAGTVILFLTLLICFVAATRLRRPLAALTAAVTQTAAGARTGPVPLRGTNEMRELGVAINDLAVQLADAERRRQDMIGDIAHELRTPLGNIRGWMEAMQDEVVSADPVLIGRLLDEALMLQGLIDELQDLALADAGQLTVHPELVDVADLAQQVVTAGRATADPAVPVSCQSSGDTFMELDPVRFRQVLGNLVSNAQRATESGAITITVSGRSDAVALEVTDTGHGIAEEQVPYLFDRFWRADKSRSRTRGGSGLGLAIAQALVSAHGGRVEVRSQVGSGTTVTVVFPRLSPADGSSPA